MNIEEVLKAFLPLAFIAIWAIFSLFSRENRPIPRQPMGPRPGGFPPPPRPAQGGIPTDPGRFANPGVARQAPARGGVATRDDEILIIRPEPTRAPARPIPSAGQARRSTKPRSAPAAAPKRAESAPTRGSLANVSGIAVTQQIKAKPIEVTRLPGVQPGLQPAPAALQAQPSLVGKPLIDVRQLIASRDQVRAAFLLSEILQPPRCKRRQ
jgi:hypothetical protein